MVRVFAYALIPAGALIVGGIAALFRSPGPKVQSSIQHFAAGVLFAALATELLPDVVHQKKPAAAVAGFAGGVALMLLVKWILEALNKTKGKKDGKQQDSKAQELPATFLATVAVDIVVDGVVLGIGFSAGTREGVLLTIALGIELLSLGLSSSARLWTAGISKMKTTALAVGLGLLFVAGAVAGSTILRGLSGAYLEIVLAFGCAVLLYLVTEELLVEAHEVPETPLLTSTFFLGFIILLVIEMMA